MEAEINIKSDNKIQENEINLIDNKSILTLHIKDSKGKETGECLQFNLEDIELPLKYQDLIEQDKKNRAYLKNQFTIIDKKQDHVGKKLLSANEEARIKAMVEFYNKEIEVYNMFLGENGVQKLLNGAKVSWSTFDYIDQIIEKQIMPKLEINAEDIKQRIMSKYSNKRDDVIE